MEVTVRASASKPDFGRLPSTQAPALAQFHSDPGPVQNPDKDKPFLAKRNEPTRAAPTEVLFGPFRLLPTQFLLLEGDEPVELGSRALEILIVLLERAAELISKQELMARVWPDVFVGPANLTVHMSALRRALRDGRDGNRYIINVHGRGYKFVASVAVVGPVESDGDENRAALRELGRRRLIGFTGAALSCPANTVTGDSNGHGSDRGSNGSCARTNGPAPPSSKSSLCRQS